MSVLQRRKHLIAATATACVLGIAVPVAAINVTPVVIDLASTGRRASTIITVQNTFSETVPVEAFARSIRLVDGEIVEDESTEAEDLLVFPGQATVGGNQSQAFRVQWVGDPAPKESRHFYVTVGQLPVALPGNQNAIQVLHQFKILVNVGVPDGKPALRVVKAEIRPGENGKPRPVLTIANEGTTYGYAGHYRMTLIQRSSDGRELFRESYTPEVIQRRMGLGLVPSGQTRTLPMSIELPDLGGTLGVEMSPAPND